MVGKISWDHYLKFNKKYSYEVQVKTLKNKMKRTFTPHEFQFIVHSVLSKHFSSSEKLNVIRQIFFSVYIRKQIEVLWMAKYINTLFKDFIAICTWVSRFLMNTLLDDFIATCNWVSCFLRYYVPLQCIVNVHRLLGSEKVLQMSFAAIWRPKNQKIF